MGVVINKYNPSGVDDAVLGGTGQGGLLSSGYLRDDPIESYLGKHEEAVFVRSNAKHGLTRTDVESGETERFVPGDGYRAFAVATDTRLLFLIGDNKSGSGRDRQFSVPLAEVELVDAESGFVSSEFVALTRADVRWRFPCKESVGDLHEYLDVATMTWKQVETHLEDARGALIEAENCREDHWYDMAMAALEDARDEIATAREREAAFVEAGVHAMSARIDRTESRIADAEVRTLEARATHALDSAEQRWREDDYAGAHDEFLAAHDDYVRALGVRDTDLEGSRALRKKLARVERNIASLERAPVQQANQARERADDSDDPTERADELERALRRYRQALELDWGSEDKRFTGDTVAIRERVDAVAVELVETRRRLAARRVREGDEQREAGRDSRAREHYREARDLLETTLETARELVPEETAALDAHVEAVTRKIRECTDSDVTSPVSGD